MSRRLTGVLLSVPGGEKGKKKFTFVAPREEEGKEKEDPFLYHSGGWAALSGRGREEGRKKKEENANHASPWQKKKKKAEGDGSKRKTRPITTTILREKGGKSRSVHFWKKGEGRSRAFDR